MRHKAMTGTGHQFDALVLSLPRSLKALFGQRHATLAREDPNRTPLHAIQLSLQVSMDRHPDLLFVFFCPSLPPSWTT
jgi:hypothetical protein